MVKICGYTIHFFLQDVSKFKDLETLEVLKCILNEDSLKGLEELQHLKCLTIKCDGAYSQDPLNITPKCARLEKLVLRCDVTNEQLDSFLKNCPNLKVFIALYNGKNFFKKVDNDSFR